MLAQAYSRLLDWDFFLHAFWTLIVLIHSDSFTGPPLIFISRHHQDMALQTQDEDVASHGWSTAAI
jgi:hypothetical protein